MNPWEAGGDPCQNPRMCWKHEKGSHYTNKELCLLPSTNRTSPVKASNMLSVTPRGDDHGALHWHCTRGLVPPMELPVPACSADAWTDSMAVQPCHAWPEWEQAQQGQGSLWDRNAILVTAVCGKQESCTARCVNSGETKVKQASRRGGGMCGAWSESAITVTKVQI